MSQYQEISDRELYGMMKLHYDCLRSEGTAGKRLDLRGHDLQGRTFQNYNFGGALLAEANLEKCHFENCTFSLADLSAVQASEATFDRCSFECAKLMYANMHATQHHRTIYKTLDLDHVRMDESLHDGTEFLCCNGDDLDLSSSRFVAARFDKGVYDHVDLHDATMDGTYLDSVSMYHANTKGLHLDSAILHDMTNFPILQVGPIPSIGQTSFYATYNYKTDEVSCRKLFGDRMATLEQFRDTVRKEKLLPMSKLFLKESFKLFDAAREANRKSRTSGR